MSFHLGEHVIFGRPSGEQTLAEVVGFTPSGKVKVRQLEPRGRHGEHAAGEVWTVPVELVRPAPVAADGEDDGFSLDELRLAFTYHFATKITGADGAFADAERDHLRRSFSVDALLGARFFDPVERAFTDRFSAALQLSFEVLPEALEDDDCLAILGFFLETCIVDGHFDPREAAVLLQAAKRLGMEEHRYFAWVASNANAMKPRLRAKLEEATHGLRQNLARGTLFYTTFQPTLFDVAHGIDLAERERILEVARHPNGRLTVQASQEEVRAGDIRGWEALVQLLLSEGLLMRVVGRLVVACDGFNADPRPLFEISEARDWLLRLQGRYPWLCTWLDPLVGAQLQLVACGLQSPTMAEEGGLALTDELMNLLVDLANFGVAMARNLGSRERSHVDAFLAVAGIRELPDSFFDGIEGVQAHLDANARYVKEAVRPPAEESAGPSSVSPTPLADEQTAALLEEWPCLLAAGPEGPVFVLAENDWEQMWSATAKVDQALMRAPDGSPTLLLVPTAEPADDVQRQWLAPVVATPRHVAALRALVATTQVDLQFVTWDPARGWCTAFRKRIGFDTSLATEALEAMESWLTDHPPKSPDAVMLARYGRSPLHEAVAAEAHARLGSRAERAGACEISFRQFVPDSVLPAIETLRRLTWEESIALTPALCGVARWYVDELLEELMECKRKGPAAAIRTALAFTRSEQVLDTALEDEDLLVELGFEVVPACAHLTHIDALLTMTKHSRRYYRSLAARALAAITLWPECSRGERAYVQRRLGEMASGDRSKDLRAEAARLLEMEPAELWELIGPKALERLG